jgi:hypothetical protein
MFFYHCLQQELDNLRMKILFDQYPGRASDDWHVIGRNDLVQINHTLWQYQPNDIGIKARAQVIER